MTHTKPPRTEEHRRKLSENATARWAKWAEEHEPVKCSVEICDREAKVKGLCLGHDGRRRKYGDVRADVPIRKMAERGAGKSRYLVNGYVLIAVPEGTPGRKSSGMMAEHRYVMQQMLGRPLLPAPLETVHHKDGDKQNNHPDNLELRVGNHGIGASDMHCRTCKCFE